jgi:hypothetical protein
MTDENQLQNVYFNYLRSLMTDDARYTREIQFRIALAKA